MTLRLLSQAGTPEMRALAELRTRYEDRVGPPWPAHPLFERMLAGALVLELERIVRRMAPQTIGACIEHDFTQGVAARHAVYRVPRCPSCHPAQPPRLPWNLHLAAPMVKGGVG
jgi:bacteriocin biosynthesis cyclodehydratase domain-containing protein